MHDGTGEGCTTRLGEGAGRAPGEVDGRGPGWHWLGHRWFGHFSITISSGIDADVVALRGELDIAGAGTLQWCLARLTERSVVVDVSRLTFIDAAGMSALVVGHSCATKDAQTLVVRGAQGTVRRILDLAGLAHLLDDAS